MGRYNEMLEEQRWRVGRSLGRTVYAQIGSEPSKADVLLGMMDTRELAELVVSEHNRLVRRFVESAEPTIDDPETAAMIDALKPQVPIAVPPCVGAMVRTLDQVGSSSVYMRWATDRHTSSPWIRQSDHEQPYRTDEIGRIVKVLATGVELVD